MNSPFPEKITDPVDVFSVMWVAAGLLRARGRGFTVSVEAAKLVGDMLTRVLSGMEECNGEVNIAVRQGRERALQRMTSWLEKTGG